MQYRFHRDALRLNRAIDRGVFGRVLLVNVLNRIARDAAYFAANGGWRGTWTLNGGGVLINQTTHGMDLLHWMMGPISGAIGFAATLVRDVEVEDTFSAAVEFPSGALGFIQATSGVERDVPLRLEVVGSRRSAVFERSRLTEPLSMPDEELLTAEEAAELPSAGEHAYAEPFGEAHRRQYRAIVAALRRGEQPPVSAADALGSLRTISDIYRAVGLPRRAAPRGGDEFQQRRRIA